MTTRKTERRCYEMKRLHPPKDKCVFYDEKHICCKLLYETLCITKGKCGFCKTREEYEDGLKKYPIQKEI